MPLVTKLRVRGSNNSASYSPGSGSYCGPKTGQTQRFSIRWSFNNSTLYSPSYW